MKKSIKKIMKKIVIKNIKKREEKIYKKILKKLLKEGITDKEVSILLENIDSSLIKIIQIEESLHLKNNGLYHFHA